MARTPNSGKSEQPSLYREKFWQDHDLIRDQLQAPGKSNGKLLLWMLISRMGPSRDRDTWDADVDELAFACNSSASTVRRTMALLRDELLLSYESLPGRPGWYRFRVCRANLDGDAEYAQHSQFDDGRSQIENLSTYEHQQRPTTKNTNAGAGESIPPELDCEAFREAWSRWRDYRSRVRRKPVSSTAALEQLVKLAAAGVAAASAAIDRSIANDWQGLFPEAARSTDLYAGLREFASLEEVAQ
ncbi:MAG: hypothetical protein AB7I48_23760 [Planctomycetaceae bacterium]